MSVLCGHCKNYHDSVADVKSCSLGAGYSQSPKVEQPLWGWNGRSQELKGFAPANATAEPAKLFEGRYAIDFEGQLRFFKVEYGKNKWEGYVFIKEQAGDDLFAVRNKQRRERITAAILNDPDALARYGQELGVCGDCGRTLTDETSRAIGIGPVCRDK